MPLLFAPEGVTSYSHQGHQFAVGDDGTIDVTDVVAGELRCHGFKDLVGGEIPTDETVSVKRSLVLSAMAALGVTGNPQMRSDKLLTAFETAVASKKSQPQQPQQPAKPTGNQGGNQNNGGGGK